MTGLLQGDGLQTPEQRRELAERLFAEGRKAEAAPLFEALARADPDDLRCWIRVAACREDAGDIPGAVAAYRRSLELKPGRTGERARMALCLMALGEYAEAATHWEMLVEQVPHNPKLRRRLGEAYRKLKRPDAELAATRALLDLDPESLYAHRRLADLHVRAGRSAEAVLHLRRVLEAAPDKRACWRALARCLDDLGEAEEAEAAWLKVLEFEPASIAVLERLNELRLLREFAKDASARPSRRRAEAPRLAVLGNCQAYGLAVALRALCPSIQVAATAWPSIVTADHARRVAGSLDGFDAVVIQPPPKAPMLAALSPAALHRLAGRLVLYPAIYFAGFHPDAEHWPGQRSPIGEWHSALALAAFVRGAPRGEVMDLFNAYIYGRLGYFEEYGKAVLLQRRAAEAVGFELGLGIEDWRGEPFMHVPNHPKPAVTLAMARTVAQRLGLATTADVQPPADPYVPNGAWAVYPEIARRLNLEGPAPFRLADFGEGRTAELEEVVDGFYAAYARTPPGQDLPPRVLRTIEILKEEGV